MADFWVFLTALAYTVGGVVCHQLPERSFFVTGRQLPVCARCTGLYVSAAVGLVLWLLYRSRRAGTRHTVRPTVALGAFLIAVVPTAVSWAAGVVGVWDGSNATRAVLAMPLGVTVGAIVAAVAAKDLR